MKPGLVFRSFFFLLCFSLSLSLSLFKRRYASIIERRLPLKQKKTTRGKPSAGSLLSFFQWPDDEFEGSVFLVVLSSFFFVFGPACAVDGTRRGGEIEFEKKM